MKIIAGRPHHISEDLHDHRVPQLRLDELPSQGVSGLRASCSMDTPELTSSMRITIRLLMRYFSTSCQEYSKVSVPSCADRGAASLTSSHVSTASAHMMACLAAKRFHGNGSIPLSYRALPNKETQGLIACLQPQRTPPALP
jgi:hypothetical protein